MKKIKAEELVKDETAKDEQPKQDGDITMEDAGEEVKEKKDKKGKKEKKDKKEKKEKKDKKKKSESDESITKSREEKAEKEENSTKVPETNSTESETPSKKRKRDLTTSEIEIDVNLPEPPSKKALRKLKKNPSLAAAPTPTTDSKPKSEKPKSDKPEEYPEHASQSRSKWGIWIGNLGFSTTRPQLEEFLTKPPSPIQRIEVTRINLPTDPRTKRNRGFAYIDFANEKALDYALTLSEALFLGRKVLIKNAKDFSSRNSGTSPADGPKLGPNLTSKPPSKILFVGNLDFETKDEDLKKHFEFAGKIVKVRLATFEDTGKCKGFGFIDFEDIESTKRALLGLSEREELMKNTLEGKEEKELAERQKKRRFIGPRQIKMEFGEDSSVRYKKRFGKDRPDRENGDGEGVMDAEDIPPRKKRAPKQDEDWAEQAWEKKRERIDKRSSNPGAAYSNDVRRTGVITESKGKKMKFDT